MDTVETIILGQDEVARFWADGALLVRNVMSLEEASSFRNEVESSLSSWISQGLVQSTSTGGVLRTDMLSIPLMRKLLLDPRVISLARDLLGNEPVYFGDSTLSYGCGHRAWHRDNRTSDRGSFHGLDWQGRYPLIRLGLYLQDHKHHSGGLGIRLRSHLPVTTNPLIHSKITPTRLRNFLINHTGKAINIDHSYGDIVIWTLRTLHSAEAVRLKFLPRLRVNPILENIVPHWARLADDGRRMACFMTFAASGEHLDRYLAYLQTRDYMVQIWKNSVWDEQALAMANRAGLSVMSKQVAELKARHTDKNT